MKDKVYISGKISGLDYETVKREFLKNEIKLSSFHYKVVNPFNIKPLFGLNFWFCYIIVDLWNLKKCTHIALRWNWKESRGAVIEYFFAKFVFKLKIIYL